MIEVPKIKINSKEPKITDNIISEVVQYIKSTYKVEYNTFLNNFSITQRKGKKRELTRRDLRLYLRAAGYRISSQYLDDILHSEDSNFKVAERINPIQSFIKECKGSYKGTSHIEKFANYLNPRDFGGGSNKEKFVQLYKKWFVSTIATAMGLTKNDVMFTIVQADGGTGKTEFQKWAFGLEEIEFYVKTITKNNYKTDILKEISRNILIIFDEFAAMKPNYIDTFKSEISQTSIKMNFSYQSDEILLPRIGSFAATSNMNMEKGGFIPRNDKGLLRRLFTIEQVGPINWQEYIKEVDRKQMFAEAMMLIDNDFDYIFNSEDFLYFGNYNRKYLKNLDLKELLNSLYKPGTNGESLHLNASDIQKELIELNYPEHSLSTEKIGRMLTELEFKSKPARTGDDNQPRYGYLIERR